MRTRADSRLLALTVSLAAAVAGVARGQVQATADCAGPAPIHGRVQVSYSAMWPTSCVPRNPTFVVLGGTISMHVTAVGDFCAQVFTPYTVQATVGERCDRVWATEVVIHNNNGSVNQIITGPTVRVDCSIADFNDDCNVSVQDVFDFLAAYFAGDVRADVNGAGGVTVQDVFDFLAAYFGI